jgi:hypothetical protein
LKVSQKNSEQIFGNFKVIGFEKFFSHGFTHKTEKGAAMDMTNPFN